MKHFNKINISRFVRSLLTIFVVFFLYACSGKDADNNKVPGNGKIALTFDDAFVENWGSITSEIANRGATATFFVSYYGNDHKAINTRNSEMQNILHNIEQMGFEIAAHSFGHARANEYIAEHGIQKWFNNEVKASTCLMIKDGFSIYSFAYPHSNSNSSLSDNKLLRYFGAVRTYNGASLDHSSGVYDDKSRVVMGAGIDEAVLNMTELKGIIDNVAINDSTLVLTAHDISELNENSLYIKPSTLFEIIDYGTSKGIEFINFNKVVSGTKKVDNALCN